MKTRMIAKPRTRKQAEQIARRIAKSLGPGWLADTLNTPELGGWDSYAISRRGDISVSADYRRGKLVGYIAAAVASYYHGVGDTPMEALTNLVRRVRDRVEGLKMLLTSITSDIAESGKKG